MQTPAYIRFPAAFGPETSIPSGATNGLPFERHDEESHDTAEGARAPASVDHLLPVRRNAFGVPALDACAASIPQE